MRLPVNGALDRLGTWHPPKGPPGPPGPLRDRPLDGKLVHSFPVRACARVQTPLRLQIGDRAEHRPPNEQTPIEQRLETFHDKPGQLRRRRARGYTPSPTGRRTLNIPYRGAFDDLEERYRALRGRIVDGVLAPIWESPPRTMKYASELDLPSIRCEAFALRSPDDRPLAVEGTRAMEIAAMVRHAIGGAARRAGLGEATISELMGHSNERRIWVQPLPNVGYRHADGRIRRVMLTAPERVDEEDWMDVLSRLPGEPLTPAGQRLPVGALAPVAASDPVVDQYRGEARCWTSATPVVLPGHDHRRGRPRPQRSMRRLLHHAGIAESLLESVTMEPAARLPGSARPARYGRPRHLAGYPCQHMSVRWKLPVTGPLALGVGTGYGLGLFLPTQD